MEILFSVIVPVYNVEEYIGQCIDSILKQSYKNIQVLLVNDGSEDGSRIICENYKSKDSRIQILDKENGGAASARNMGINNAVGDYILFLDGDDYWNDDDALLKINYNLKQSNADVLTFGLRKKFESTGELEQSKYIFNRELIDFKSKCNTLKYLIKNNLYISSSCNKVVKRSFIEKYNLKFKDKDLVEDIEWSANILLYSNVIDVMESPFYIYRQRQYSSTHTLTLENIKYLLMHIKNCINIYTNIEESKKDFEFEYMSYVAYQYITLLVAINLINLKTPSEIMDEIKNYRYLLKYDLINRVHIFYLINKYLGFYMLILIIKFYLRVRKDKI